MSPPPRIDLHRHLDGNIRIRTILELASKNGIVLPADNETDLRPFVTVTTPQPGLLDFLEKFRWSVGVLSTPEDCARIAFENVEDARRERLDYVELRFSPWFMAQAHGLDPAAVVEAVIDGVRRGERQFGVPTRLIGILSRTYGPEICFQELEALLAFRKQLVAIDLAGDEAGFPPALFVEHFRRVHEARLAVTIHAGEAAGPESIRDALDLLGAQRIGHGVRAIEDLELMARLARERIPLECCPTSNVQTSTVRSLESHPLRTFVREGLCATINTDDPGISAITMDEELAAVVSGCGLTPEEVDSCLKNAALAAFDFPGARAMAQSIGQVKVFYIS